MCADIEINWFISTFWKGCNGYDFGRNSASCTVILVIGYFSLQLSRTNICIGRVPVWIQAMLPLNCTGVIFDKTHYYSVKNVLSPVCEEHEHMHNMEMICSLMNAMLCFLQVQIS